MKQHLYFIFELFHVKQSRRLYFIYHFKINACFGNLVYIKYNTKNTNLEQLLKNFWTKNFLKMFHMKQFI